MDFLNDFGSNVSKWLQNVTGDIGNWWQDTALNTFLPGKEPGDQDAQAWMNKTGQVAAYQDALSKMFEAGKEDYRQSLKDSYTKPIRQEMTQNLQNVKQDASRRGLIGSGIEKRNAANTIAKYKSDFSQGSDQANRDTNEMSDALKYGAIDSGLTAKGIQTNNFADALNTSIQKQIAQQQQFSGLMQGAGNFAGMYAGSKKT